MKLDLIVLSLLLLPAGLIAQTPASNANLKSDPVYRSNCAKCHGKTAEGRHFGGPSLLSDKVQNMAADDLQNVIKNGKGRMPKYAGKLSQAEIDALIHEIKAQTPK